MSVDSNFAQFLRPIGQMLEPLQIESFALRVDTEGVFVRAQKAPERRAPPPQEVSLRAVWQVLRRKKTEPVQEPKPSSGVVELHYTRDDIARMDTEGKARRNMIGGSPEAHALSQILRAVGAFVDQKQGRLIGVTKEGQDIAIDYESALKGSTTEKFTVSSLYDYWVKMYLRRRERS